MNALLAVVLSSWAAAAPAAPQAQPAAPAATVADLSAEVKKIEDCVDTYDYFREDLKKKEDQLDKEFKGQVPSAFNDLFKLKRGRISKQQLACAAMISASDAPFQSAESALRSLDSTTKEYESRRKTIGDLRGRLNAAIKRFASQR
jgi:hypothetical protein